MPLRETDVRRLLRRLLEEGVFVVSSHARTEMKKDNLTDVDVVNILRGGVVQPAEWENGSWRYRVLTQRMAAVAAFEPDVEAMPSDDDDVSDMELIVVTAWRTKVMKKCKHCSGEMASSREAYRYNESGLPNVILKDVEIRRCRACGAQEVPIPRVAELHRAIALALVHKPARFLGTEVRYLRRYMGWSGVDFASHMGVSPETVSRWENEKEVISSTSDRLLRLIVVRSWPVEDYSVDDLVKIDDRRDPPPAHVELRVQGRHWQLAAA